MALFTADGLFFGANEVGTDGAWGIWQLVSLSAICTSRNQMLCSPRGNLAPGWS